MGRREERERGREDFADMKKNDEVLAEMFKVMCLYSLVSHLSI